MEEEKVLEEDFIEKKIERRRKLLPTWIKVFVWIFMFFGAIIPLVFVIALVAGSADLSLYGFSTTNPLSGTGLMIIGLFTLKGAVAFSLWFEKDWAIKLGMLDASIGIIICIGAMIGIMGGSEGFRAELLLLLPYQYKLFKIKNDWESIK